MSLFNNAVGKFKEEVAQLVEKSLEVVNTTKVDKKDVYTKQDIIDMGKTMEDANNQKMQTYQAELQQAASKIEELTSKLNEQSSNSETSMESIQSSMNTAMDEMSDIIVKVNEIVATMNRKSDVGHEHDERYLQKSELPPSYSPEYIEWHGTIVTTNGIGTITLGKQFKEIRGLQVTPEINANKSSELLYASVKSYDATTNKLTVQVGKGRDISGILGVIPTVEYAGNVKVYVSVYGK